MFKVGFPERIAKKYNVKYYRKINAYDAFRAVEYFLKDIYETAFLSKNKNKKDRKIAIKIYNILFDENTENVFSKVPLQAIPINGYGWEGETEFTMMKDVNVKFHAEEYENEDTLNDEELINLLDKKIDNIEECLKNADNMFNIYLKDKNSLADLTAISWVQNSMVTVKEMKKIFEQLKLKRNML